jgi:hypothetical protein
MDEDVIILFQIPREEQCLKRFKELTQRHVWTGSSLTSKENFRNASCLCPGQITWLLHYVRLRARYVFRVCTLREGQVTIYSTVVDADTHTTGQS